MSSIIPFDQVQAMGRTIAQSGLFGVKTADQAVALMLIAQAEGKHPASAAQEYHVIQGRPCLKSDAMLARFQAAGGTVKWGRYDDEAVSATFSHPSGGSVTIDWSFAQAKKIGLTGKDNWRNYPRQMLRARVISEGIRTCYPGIAVGVYTPEEGQDIPEETEVDVKILGPSDEQRAATETLKQRVASLRATAILVAKQTSNVAVTDLLRKYGATKVSEIPEGELDAFETQLYELTVPQVEAEVEPAEGDVL